MQEESEEVAQSPLNSRLQCHNTDAFRFPVRFHLAFFGS